MFTLILNTWNCNFDQLTGNYSWTVNWGNIIDPFTSNKQRFLVVHSYSSEYVSSDDNPNLNGHFVVACNLQSFGYSPYLTKTTIPQEIGSDTSIIRSNGNGVNALASGIQNPINVASAQSPIQIPQNQIYLMYKADKSQFICDNVQEISVININHLHQDEENLLYSSSIFIQGTHKFIFTPI